ncbi:hypothetical protein PAXRUDRAFT_84373, partial [Paxillus rubicundulus Ve08.2h10]
SSAWEATQLKQNFDAHMHGDEFVWADSAYPLQTWVVAPYKAPEKISERNMEFNNHVSMLRIRSEHAIGFLKGRFQSLKGLLVRIVDEKSHKFATYWVAACIGLHAFAVHCENKEKES